MNDISAAFHEQLLVTDVLPVSRFLQYPPGSDLIISTLPVETGGRHTVRVNPILTRQNQDSIQKKLDEIGAERELLHARTFLRSLFHKELYFRNVALDSAEAYIKFMGGHCLEHGYVKEAFIQDVLLRESVSSNNTS